MDTLSNDRFGTLYGDRLNALAEMEAITVSDLANQLDMSQSWLSRVIHGELQLPIEVAHKASDIFEIPMEFFAVAREPQEAAAVTWRKQASSSKRADKQVTRVFEEAARLWRITSQRSIYKVCILPDPASCEDIEDTAHKVRKLGGLNETEPIKNMVRLAERLGIGVISPLQDTFSGEAKHTGISKPSKYEDRPLLCCVTGLDGAVQRLTVAHELGHLIFDKDLIVHPKARGEEETRAFWFAGALLIPESVMKNSVEETTPLSAFLRLKATYGISIGALVKRARNLELISQQREKSLYIQISSRGWRNNEPVEVATETPQLLSQALRTVWPTDTIRTASRETGVKQKQIAYWTREPLPAETQNNLIEFPRQVAGCPRR